VVEIPNQPSNRVDPENSDLPSELQRLSRAVDQLPARIVQAFKNLPGGAGGQQLGKIETTLSQMLDLQKRYGGGRGGEGGGAAAAGMMFGQSLPQARQEAIHQVAMWGGMPPEHATRGMTKVTPMGALSSLENLQTFLAQRMGERIAGRSLYAAPEEEEGGPPGGGGGTPAGETTTRDVVAAATAEADQNTATVQAAQATLGAGGGAADSSAGVGNVVAAGSRLAALGARAAPRAGAPAAGMVSAGGAHAAGGGWGVMQQVGARVALSGGTAQGLLGALRRLPVIGLGMDIAERAASFYQTQREEGRQFQTIEGGSNLQAQWERVHEAIYGLSMFGRMPEGAANYAFNAVTQMGLNRAAYGQAFQPQNRQNALGFIYQNYTNTGMSVQESARMLDVVTRNVSINLNTVRDALSELSNTAGQAGTNAQTARQGFAQLLGTAIDQGAGMGAPVVAGGIANMQAALGRPFAGLNMAGGLSQQRQYMLAGQLGISPNQLQWMERFRPQQYAQALGSANRQWIENSGINQNALNDLQQIINSTPGAKQMNAQGGAVRDQIFNQWLYKWQAQDPSLNLYSMSQILSRLTGYPINPNNVGDFITAQYAGINEAAGTGRLANQGQAVRATDTSTAPQGRYGLAEPTKQVFARGQLLATATTWQGTLLHGRAPQAAQNYLSQESRTGQRDPVLESLLQSSLTSNDQVRVQTRTGPRMMSVSDAMKYYPNELAQGNVQFFDQSGKLLGGTAGFTGGLTAPSRDVTAEEKQQAGSRTGEAMSLWQRQHPQAFAGSGQMGAKVGNVTVDLTQEAKQLLKLLPSVNDQAAAQGFPSANPAVAQSSR